MWQSVLEYKIMFKEYEVLPRSIESFKKNSGKVIIRIDLYDYLFIRIYKKWKKDAYEKKLFGV